jgi:hypothetical protein
MNLIKIFPRHKQKPRHHRWWWWWWNTTSSAAYLGSSNCTTRHAISTIFYTVKRMLQNCFIFYSCHQSHTPQMKWLPQKSYVKHICMYLPATKRQLTEAEIKNIHSTDKRTDESAGVE